MKMEKVILLLSLILIIFILYNIFISCLLCEKENFEKLDDIGYNISDNDALGLNLKGSIYDLQFTNNSNASTLQDEIKKLRENKNNTNTKNNIYKDLEVNIKANKNALPLNSVSFFQDTIFKPECCPSQYSSSKGCACMTPEKMKFLSSRGGNAQL